MHVSDQQLREILERKSYLYTVIRRFLRKQFHNDVHDVFQDSLLELLASKNSVEKDPFSYLFGICRLKSICWRGSRNIKNESADVVLDDDVIKGDSFIVKNSTIGNAVFPGEIPVEYLKWKLEHEVLPRMTPYLRDTLITWWNNGFKVSSHGEQCIVTRAKDEAKMLVANPKRKVVHVEYPHRRKNQKALKAAA